MPKAWPVWLVLLAVAFVLAVAVAGREMGRVPRPWLLAGWLWFLGGLVPNIGLVQAGGQAMGDRFVYLPILGLFIVAVWLLPECLPAWRHRTAVLATLSLAALLAALTLTSIQLQHWRNTITVFDHAVKVTKNNPLAHDLLAATFAYQGKTDEAIAHCNALLAIDPKSVAAQRTWGVALAKKGESAQAISHFAARR